MVMKGFWHVECLSKTSLTKIVFERLRTLLGFKIANTSRPLKLSKTEVKRLDRKWSKDFVWWVEGDSVHFWQIGVEEWISILSVNAPKRSFGGVQHMKLYNKPVFSDDWITKVWDPWCLHSRWSSACVCACASACVPFFHFTSSYNSFFLFNRSYYKQVEGLGMGLPLGPTLASIFMCHHEETWIRDCPAAFAPAKYLRYIDDTFLIFRHKSHIEFFLIC